MPTVLRLKGFRFFFYSNEGNENIHVHIAKGDAEGKIWLEPDFEIAYMYGFEISETIEIEAIIVENREHLKKEWNEYFNK